ncbi:type IV pilus assembly protein PilM [Candidatus Latescibacterota bacterium]
MQLLRKQQNVIGLDIGTSMIKAAQVTMKGKKYILENYAIEAIEEGTLQSGEIKNLSSLAQSAEKVVKQCNASIKDVVVALPSFSILSDVLSMKLRPEKEMREAVLVEAQRISPFDMSEVEIDYAELERNEEEKTMKVLMVAAKNDIILTYIDFLNEAGLRPVIVDVDLFALTNIFHLNYDTEKYKTCIILNIGSESTIAAFLHEGKFHSSRDISVAGANFINELQLVPDMTPEKIHDIVKGNIDSEFDPKSAVNALNKAGKEFANAVGVAVSYFQATDNVEVDLIVLTGGYAWIPGLINILELRTGSEVIIMDPFINIEYTDKITSEAEAKKLGTVLSVAMGLATRTY